MVDPGATGLVNGWYGKSYTECKTGCWPQTLWGWILHLDRNLSCCGTYQPLPICFYHLTLPSRCICVGLSARTQMEGLSWVTIWDVTKLCILLPPTFFWWTVNGRSLATVAQCTEPSCLNLTIQSGHSGDLGHHHHWTDAEEDPDFHRRTRLSIGPPLLTRLQLLLQQCNHHPDQQGDRFYFDFVGLSCFSCIVTFFIILLLNYNSNLKYLSRYLCRFHFSHWFTFKPAIGSPCLKCH